jgi:hypothetical protein
MALQYSQVLCRRGFCIWCMAAAGLGADGGWSSPAEASHEPRDIVDLIRDYAAKAPIQLHKLRGNVTIIKGSGRNMPGHASPVSNKTELASFRDMLVAIRANVAKLKQQGRSLDETIARPTAAFDTKWGQFLITPAFFTKLVYEGV